MKELFLKLNLQFFAEGDGGEPQTPEPTTEPQGAAEPPTPEPQTPQAPSLTIDAVQKFLNEQEDGKKFLQSVTDSRVTDAIKTYEAKTLPKKVQEEINKRYPPETEDAKQLRAMQADLEAMRHEAEQEKLKNAALQSAADFGVPTELIDLFIREDKETTEANMARYKEQFDAAVDARVQAEIKRRFNESTDNPLPPAQQKPTITKEQIAQMSPAEINANWAEVQKVMSGN